MRKSLVDDGHARPGSGVGHQFSLAPPPNGDHGALIKASTGWQDACGKTLHAFDKRVGRSNEAIQRFRTERSKLLGDDAAQQFAAHSREHRAAAKAMLRSGRVADRPAEFRRAREQSVRLMADVGASMAKLRALQAAYSDELRKIMLPRAEAVGGLSSVTRDQVPQAALDFATLSTHGPIVTSDGLTIFRPPFDGWWWKGNWWHSGGETPEIDIYPDPSTGAIGHRSHWYNGDASDADAIALEYHTSISAWYKPAKTSALDVWILATCASAHYNIYLDDEWGWSDSASTMRSQITANVSPVIDDEDLTENWSISISGNPDGAIYADDPSPAGNVRFFHLKTTQPVPANVWSLLRVGTRDDRFTILNDVSTSQLMRNRWFVSGIFVRSA